MISYHTSFNENLCHKLEYHLSSTFRNANAAPVKYFWCDGIAMPQCDNQLAKETIKQTQQLVTKAYLGNTGQELYEAIICFGLCALDRYMNDLSLDDCLPSDEDASWIDLDTVTKVIRLQLL